MSVMVSNCTAISLISSTNEAPISDSGLGADSVSSSGSGSRSGSGADLTGVLGSWAKSTSAVCLREVLPYFRTVVVRDILNHFQGVVRLDAGAFAFPRMCLCSRWCGLVRAQDGAEKCWSPIRYFVCPSRLSGQPSADCPRLMSTYVRMVQCNAERW